MATDITPEARQQAVDKLGEIEETLNLVAKWLDDHSRNLGGVMFPLRGCQGLEPWCLPVTLPCATAGTAT
jgi:hypothetical protein